MKLFIIHVIIGAETQIRARIKMIWSKINMHSGNGR
jgi:Flp pilus assembly pilin Flp